MRIRHPKEFLTGGMFVFFGGSATVMSTGLTIGTAAKMGPGYFPLILGALLVGLGIVLLLRSIFGSKDSHGWPMLQIKPVGIVLTSVVMFSLILRPLGLLMSTAVLVVLASTASHEFRWKEALLNAAVLVAIILVVFVYFLEFPLPVWPAFTSGRG
jgi:hypothetical protein